MFVPILVPDVGTDPVRLSLWYVELGDRVLAGDRLVEIQIPGVTIDIPAPISGVLTKRDQFPMDLVQVGQTLGMIESDETPI